MSNRQQLRSDVRAELKIDINGRIWSDGVINKAIVKAVTKIEQDGNYDWGFNDNAILTASTINVSGYTLPSNFVRLDGVVKFNDVNLIPVDYKYITTITTGVTPLGTPSYYFIRGNKLYFDRKATASNVPIYFDCRSKLPFMALDTDDSGMPIEFDEAIIQYACYILWKQIQGREEKATSAIQYYKETMEGLYAQFLGRLDDANFQFSYETLV